MVHPASNGCISCVTVPIVTILSWFLLTNGKHHKNHGSGGMAQYILLIMDRLTLVFSSIILLFVRLQSTVNQTIWQVQQYSRTITVSWQLVPHMLSLRSQSAVFMNPYHKENV